jgi:signal transduction histidine kinase
MLIDTDRLVEIVAKIRQMFQRDRQSFDRIDPTQSIELALQGLAPELRAAEIEIQTELQKDLWLWGEATQLQMLFVNLLRNAKEALNTVSGRRRVTVRSELREGFVVFSILDNGPGVPDGRKATLFDLYHSSKESGLGVGLWICRMVAEHHRGSIHYSDAPHRGAQFTVTLPVLEAP